MAGHGAGPPRAAGMFRHPPQRLPGPHAKHGAGGV